MILLRLLWILLLGCIFIAAIETLPVWLAGLVLIGAAIYVATQIRKGIRMGRARYGEQEWKPRPRARGLWQPNGCAGRSGSSNSIRSHSQSIILRNESHHRPPPVEIGGREEIRPRLHNFYRHKGEQA
jgi:hypothetical protein